MQSPVSSTELRRERLVIPNNRNEAEYFADVYKFSTTIAPSHLPAQNAAERCERRGRVAAIRARVYARRALRAEASAQELRYNETLDLLTDAITANDGAAFGGYRASADVAYCRVRAIMRDLDPAAARRAAEPVEIAA
jgi:hypothetical protein